jgi:hypothetical protein
VRSACFPRRDGTRIVSGNFFRGTRCFPSGPICAKFTFAQYAAQGNRGRSGNVIASREFFSVVVHFEGSRRGTVARSRYPLPSRTAHLRPSPRSSLDSPMNPQNESFPPSLGLRQNVRGTPTRETHCLSGFAFSWKRGLHGRRPSHMPPTGRGRAGLAGGAMNK